MPYIKVLCLVVSDNLKRVTPVVGQFLVPGHNLNRLCSGLLGDATYQISKL